MSPEELTKVLQSHQLWLDSDGKEGEKANFEGADLQKADLQDAILNGAEFRNAILVETNLQGALLEGASFDGVELQGADLRNAFLTKAKFRNAILTKTNLQGALLLGASFDGATLFGEDLRNAFFAQAEFKNATLTEANLQGATLRQASFDGAILQGTNLREADLQNANLENAKSLLSSQLAGADVAGAKLPSAIAEFKGLETIAEATSNAQKLLVAMLGGCLYSWLTIGTTKDAALLTNSASSPLPIIGTALPIVGFYMVAPIVLLAMYFYFHLNMQRLWEALADLPAVFPDGRSLDKRADPWLLNGLVSAHFVRLRRERPSLSRVQQWLSILLAWWVVPVTLFVFWGRFLTRHDWLGTSLHIGLLAAAIGFGWMSYRLACATLRGAPRKPSFVMQAFGRRIILWRRVLGDRRIFKRAAGILGMCVIGVVLYYISLGAIEGVPRDLANPSDFSENPDGYTPSGVSPNALRSRVPGLLEHIGFTAFAKLEEEDVSTKPPNWTGDAKEHSLVKGAHLRNAKLQYANASGAFLANADLRGANLVNAILSGADLSYANLEGANLSHTNLREANLTNADLMNADLTGADLTGAKGLTKSQMEKAKTDELPKNLPP